MISRPASFGAGEIRSCPQITREEGEKSRGYGGIMRLKKLELYGFKSFAQRTEIVLNEGITAIVGPNGSGKSNIGDAVRWVLGEQSARLLRGASMQDVIFNGTQKRKPLSYCEVSLVFDNEDRALPAGLCRGDGDPPGLPDGGERILPEPQHLPAEGRDRPFPGHGHRQGGLFHHRPGPHRRNSLPEGGRPAAGVRGGSRALSNSGPARRKPTGSWPIPWTT